VRGCDPRHRQLVDPHCGNARHLKQVYKQLSPGSK
jgi:hypothetical protein